VTRGLRIAADLALPVDVVTQPIAILARRGAGKTYTAAVLVEEVIRAKVPVVVLDPTGAWWGLRSSVDGEKPGLPVVIFGGDHGDVPLEPTAGRVIADVVLEHPGAYVVDLSGLESKAAEQRFAGDFLERLYRGKKRETGPLLLVVDEADVFAPQRPGPDQTRTLGALESIVRRGRIKGLGDLLISQRAAVLNKNVLTQTEVLVAMQTTGPQDRAAIDEWIAGNGSREDRDDVLMSLASLERGEAWIWSPAFLRMLRRVRIRRRTTFDSSRTPAAGETPSPAPEAFARVDLAALGERIRDSVEQAKANDPAELRRRIRELEARSTESHEPPAMPEVRIERVEVPVLNGQVDELRVVVGQMRDVGEQLGTAAGTLITTASVIVDAIDRVAAAPRPAPEHRSAATPARATAQGRTEAPPAGTFVGSDPASSGPILTPAGGVSSEALKPVDRAVLRVLAQFPGGRSQRQVGILAGYSPTSGGLRGSLAKLRALGFVEGGGTELRVTAGGLEAVGDVEPLPSGAELLRYWLGRLSKAEAALLELLVSAYPRPVSQAELADRAGYSPTSGGVRGAIAKLQALELIEGPGAALRASADLAEAVR
jgi:hypothetical protein